MDLILPQRLQLSDLPELAFRDRDSGAFVIDIPDVSCEFHPMVACMISAISSTHARTSVMAASQEVEPSDVAALSRMDVLPDTARLAKPNSNSGDSTGSYIPVRQITKNREMGDFATDFVPLLHANAEQSNAVKYVLSELIRNVLEHSGSQLGAFAAAEATADGVIRVGVADTGIGIKRSIRRSHSAPDERRAIALALSPGVSGSTPQFGGNEQNGGAGLFFMKAMASLARENMAVISGSTIMTIPPQTADPAVVNPDLDDDTVTWTELEVPFEGTAVGVDFALRDSIAFAELLSELRTIYRGRVRAKKIQAKKARFT
jgi:anti-sigma regulatory factor (Ser/Thr protein kinase)